MFLGLLMASVGSSGVATPANEFHIASDTTSADLFVICGSPATAAAYTVYVDPGVKARVGVGVGFAVGTVLTLINRGSIYGAGGSPNGGHAITLPVLGNALTLRIDNTLGFIWGGGGRGSPGPAGVLIDAGDAGGGGGGGGGQGYPGGTGGPGTGGLGSGTSGATGANGSIDAPGAGGASGTGSQSGASGGSGGTWGSPGGNSDANNAGTIGTSVGTAGKAVSLGIWSVIWLGGYDSSRVKGGVSP